MSTPQTSLEPPQKAVDRLGFIADLGFILCTVWFILWRSELSGAARGSLWATWWPAIGLGGLVLAALAIGFVQRKPRGFLPYSLRWTFLGILLVLPIWLALSMIEAGSRENSLKSIASEARQEAMQSLALASSDEERQAQQQVIEAADAGLKLAEVLDAAEAKGIAIPKVDLASTLPPEALDRLDPGTVDTLERSPSSRSRSVSRSPPGASVARLPGPSRSRCQRRSAPRFSSSRSTCPCPASVVANLRQSAPMRSKRSSVAGAGGSPPAGESRSPPDRRIWELRSTSAS